MGIHELDVGNFADQATVFVGIEFESKFIDDGTQGTHLQFNSQLIQATRNILALCKNPRFGGVAGPVALATRFFSYLVTQVVDADLSCINRKTLVYTGFSQLE